MEGRRGQTVKEVRGLGRGEEGWVEVKYAGIGGKEAG